MNGRKIISDSSDWLSDEVCSGWVSVIMPAFNNADVISDTLESVLGQTYRPIEMIIVDDGSSDSTRGIIESWNERLLADPSIVVKYFFQTNQGGSAARNVGLKQSRGEYIQFLDADDLIAPNKITNQVALYSQTADKSTVYGPWRYFKAHRKRIDVFKENNAVDESSNALCQWISGWFVPCHSILWRRTDIQALGPWDETLQADQDGEYVLRYMLQGGELKFSRNSWAYYRLNSPARGNVSQNHSIDTVKSRVHLAQRVEKLLEKSDSMNDEYRKALAIRYYEIAKFWAFRHPVMQKFCMAHFRRLSPDMTVPGSALYRILKKLIGESAANKSRHWVRAIPGFSAKKTVTKVKFLHELTNFDDGHEKLNK